MLQIGKLIQPKVDTVSVEVERFDLKEREWLPPFEVKLSLSKEKFASGAFRDAYKATLTSGRLQAGQKYLLKKVRKEQAN